MRITSRVAGVSLQDGAIMIALGYKYRHHSCFDDFTTLYFPDGELADGWVQNSAAVSAALTDWIKGWCSIARVSSMESSWQTQALNPHQPPVGASLLAIAICQSHQCDR